MAKGDITGRKTKAIELFLNKNEHWAGKDFKSVIKMIAKDCHVRQISVKNWLLDIPDYLKQKEYNYQSVQKQYMQTHPLAKYGIDKSREDLLKEILENLSKQGGNTAVANKYLLEVLDKVFGGDEKQPSEGLTADELTQRNLEAERRIRDLNR